MAANYIRQARRRAYFNPASKFVDPFFCLRLISAGTVEVTLSDILKPVDGSKENPEVVSPLNKLTGKISTNQLIALNSAVDHDQRSDREVAKEFLEEFGFQTDINRRAIIRIC